MGERDHDRAVDHLRTGSRLTIAWRGPRTAGGYAPWALEYSVRARGALMGRFWAALQLDR